MVPIVSRELAGSGKAVIWKCLSPLPPPCHRQNGLSPRQILLFFFFFFLPPPSPPFTQVGYAAEGYFWARSPSPPAKAPRRLRDAAYGNTWSPLGTRLNNGGPGRRESSRRAPLCKPAAPFRGGGGGGRSPSSRRNKEERNALNQLAWLELARSDVQ